MALIRWQPFQEVETLRRQFDQLFSELAGESRETEIAWMPAIEFQDSPQNLIIRAQIPGVSPSDLDIQATKDTVFISGEHRYENKAEEQGYVRSEFRYGKFQRVIPLPAHIQNDQVKADFNNGVLTLTLPKAQAAQRQVVKINLGDNQSIAGSDNSKTIESAGEANKYHAADESHLENVQNSESVTATS